MKHFQTVVLAFFRMELDSENILFLHGNRYLLLAVFDHGGDIAWIIALEIIAVNEIKVSAVPYGREQDTRAPLLYLTPADIRDSEFLLCWFSVIFSASVCVVSFPLNVRGLNFMAWPGVDEVVRKSPISKYPFSLVTLRGTLPASAMGFS